MDTFGNHFCNWKQSVTNLTQDKKLSKCSKVFGSRWVLHIHMDSVHKSGKSDYICSECDKSNDTLVMHEKKCQNGEQIKYEKQLQICITLLHKESANTYECTHCVKSLTRKDNF